MIFAKTIDLVIAREKTQTLRSAYPGDYLGTATDGHVAVLTSGGRARWIVGHTYAVQRARGLPAEAWIRITSLHETPDPTAIDIASAAREGFSTIAEFLTVWHELHPSNPLERSWAIGFELCRKTRRRRR